MDDPSFFAALIRICCCVSEMFHYPALSTAGDPCWPGHTFPNSLRLALKHLILSHHGEYEYGSPKLPMTVEAIALHYLDSLDARMHSISDLIKSDANSDSNWTTYQPALGRKFCKSLSDAD